MSDERDDNDITIEPEDEARDGFGRTGKEKKLREQLKACQSERQEYLAGWQRAKADLINRNKQFEEERRKILDFASEDLIHELLSVLDSFSMAFSNKDSWESVDATWRSGVEHIYSQLRNIMKSHGVEEEDPLGEQFDPNEHESVGTEPTDEEGKDGTIAAVIQKGYRLKGKQIRPARVRVYEFHT